MAKRKLTNKIQPVTHDAFFRRHFGRVELVRDYITDCLPKEVSKLIELDSLTRCESSYVGKKYEKLYSDVVYDAKLTDGKPFLLSLLFEHKSKQPKCIELQLLGYMLQRWEEDFRNKRSLTFVLPIVVYHGKKKWDVKSMDTYFPGLPEALMKYLPTFEYLLTDLASTPFSSIEEVKADNLLRSVLAALKFAMQSEVQPMVYNLILKNQVEDVFREFCLYIYSVIDPTKAAQIELLIKEDENLDSMTKAKSAFQAIIDRGVELGKEQGIELGKELATQQKNISVIKNLLQRFSNYSDDLIAELVDCEVQLVAEVRSGLKN
jgi:predicted transposase/invertase (TIGR01784 family)